MSQPIVRNLPLTQQQEDVLTRAIELALTPQEESETEDCDVCAAAHVDCSNAGETIGDAGGLDLACGDRIALEDVLHELKKPRPAAPIVRAVANAA